MLFVSHQCLLKALHAPKTFCQSVVKLMWLALNGLYMNTTHLICVIMLLFYSISVPYTCNKTRACKSKDHDKWTGHGGTELLNNCVRRRRTHPNREKLLLLWTIRRCQFAPPRKFFRGEWRHLHAMCFCFAVWSDFSRQNCPVLWSVIAAVWRIFIQGRRVLISHWTS